MKRLNYETLQQQKEQPYVLQTAPERVLQFGEGNFLRGFVDYFFDIANETCDFNGKIVLVQPIAQGLADSINEQEGLYTLYLRGTEQGKTVNEKRVVSAVSRCINPYANYMDFLACAHNPDLRYLVSNTTEAGITYDDSCQFTDAPASAFPAKLTRFLYERYTHFAAQKGKGFIILPCELIDNNAQELKKCVQQYIRLWQLSDAFAQWVEDENLFCNTLVDRIVTGYPKDEAAALNTKNGYEDKLLDTAEKFGLWVIEGPAWLKEELPFHKAGLSILVVADHTPYKKRKVRILNGAHTAMVPAAYLCGENIVRNCMYDAVIKAFMEKAIYDEIIHTLTLPKEDLLEFAAAVTDRFCNPFIDHALLSITLNCTAKWKARVLPSVKAYLALNGKLPACLTFSFAAYLALYRNGKLQDGKLICHRGQEAYQLQDDMAVLQIFDALAGANAQILTHTILQNTAIWGEDLSALQGFEAAVVHALEAIEKHGVKACMQQEITR